MKEIDWENYIVAHPEYLEKGLTLFNRQHKVDGGIIDLIFTDSQSQYLIVELQLGKLDPSHFSRSIYYRTLLCAQKNLSPSNVRVAVASHSINNHIKTLCQSLGIEIFTLKETDEIREISEALNSPQGVSSKKLELDFFGQSLRPLSEIIEPKETQLFIKFYQYLALHQKVSPKTEAEILAMPHEVPNCWLLIDRDQCYESDTFKFNPNESLMVDKRSDYYFKEVYRDLSPAMIFTLLRKLKKLMDKTNRYDTHELSRIFTNKNLPQAFIIYYLKMNERYFKPLSYNSNLEKEVIMGLCSSSYRQLRYKQLAQIFRAGLSQLNLDGRSFFNHLPDTYTNLSIHY